MGEEAKGRWSPSLGELQKHTECCPGLTVSQPLQLCALAHSCRELSPLCSIHVVNCPRCAIFM